MQNWQLVPLSSLSPEPEAAAPTARRASASGSHVVSIDWALAAAKCRAARQAISRSWAWRLLIMALLMCPQFLGRLLCSVGRRFITGMLEGLGLGSVGQAISTLVLMCRDALASVSEEVASTLLPDDVIPQNASTNAMSWLLTAALMLWGHRLAA